MQKYTAVQEFMDDLGSDKRAQVEALRRLILSAHLELDEHIKWNAPSYVLNGEDRITFNIMNKEGLVKLVLHMGATRKEDKNAEPIMGDDSGLIQWSSDTRGVIAFTDISDVHSKQEAVGEIIKRWLAVNP